MDAEHHDWARQALRDHEGPLLRYAVSLTGDLEAARDAVQDTFLRLFEQEPGAVDGRLAPWLFTVCRNRVLDRFRKEHRMSPLDDEQSGNLPAPEPTPAASAEQSDHAAAVQRLLAGLPANQREVVRLKFQNQLSYEEIAAVTRLSVSNVGFLLHTALKTLRQRMAALETTR